MRGGWGGWCELIDGKIVSWEREGKEVCEEVWQDWLRAHNEAAERGVGLQKAKKRKEGARQMRGNEQVAELAKMRNKVRREMARKTGAERERLWKVQSKMKMQLRSLMRRERRRREVEWSKELEELSVRDAREYWARLRAMAGLGKGGREVPEEMKQEGKLVGGEAAKRVWQAGFQKLGKKADGEDERYDRAFLEQTRKLVQKWGEGTDQGGELGEPMSLEEVQEAVGQLRSGKAPGVDGVVNEVLKYGGEGMERALHKLFTIFFERERVPADWTRGLVVPLYKDGDKHEVDNYRGITLLSVVGKLYTVVLNNRLSKWCEKRGVLVDEQAGFRVNRSTVDQIYALREVIQGRRKTRLDSYCCFLDIKKAYDTVFREGLWRRL